MADPIDLGDLKRQLQAHLNSLRSAGVEWLPQGPPLNLTLAVAKAEVSTAPAEPRSTILAQAAMPSPMPTVPVAARPQPLPVAEKMPPVAEKNPAEMSLAERQQALDKLAQEVKRCFKCKQLASTRTQTVFADGKAGAELCFIGEAPGADEDAQGIPFVGESGQLLNDILRACGFKREDVYICNIIKCRPPGNRTPLPDEANNCKDFLTRQLTLVRPKFIVALGACAAANLLGTSQSIGKLRGRFHDYQGIPVLATYHPAYLLPHRSPEKKREVWDDMKMLLAKMGRAVPGR